MPLPIYPERTLLPGLTYSSKWTPQFFNQSVATATGASIDLRVAQDPLHEFELTYSFLRDGPDWKATLSALEFRTLMGFHLLLAGTSGRFLYRNPDDHQVWRNRIATGDGATTVFPLTRSFGANGYFSSEPVGQANTDAGVNVYLAGSPTPLDPSLYTIDTSAPVANTLAFATAPASGAAVEVDMAYFYYCRLSDNSNSFEKFMAHIWSIGSIKLQSCRAGA